MIDGYNPKRKFLQTESESQRVLHPADRCDGQRGVVRALLRVSPHTEYQVWLSLWLQGYEKPARQQFVDFCRLLRR